MRDRIVTKLLDRAEEADRLRRSKKQPTEAQRRRTRLALKRVRLVLGDLSES